MPSIPLVSPPKELQRTALGHYFTIPLRHKEWFFFLVSLLGILRFLSSVMQKRMKEKRNLGFVLIFHEPNFFSFVLLTFVERGSFESAAQR